MSPHLLYCQGLAVDDYSVALGRLKPGVTSTFVQLGYEPNKIIYLEGGALNNH